MITDPEKLKKIYEERTCIICKGKYFVSKTEGTEEDQLGSDRVTQRPALQSVQNNIPNLNGKVFNL